MMKEVQEALAILNKPFRMRPDLDFCCSNLTSHEIQILNGDELQRKCEPFLSYLPSAQGSSVGYLRLSHFSVVEYLHDLSGSVPAAAKQFLSPNVIAEACLKYLSQERYTIATGNPGGSITTKSSPPASGSAIEPNIAHHFLGYAAKYWHRHVEETDTLPREIVRLFLCSPQFITMLGIQSTLLDRQFLQDPENSNDPLWEPKVNLPQSLASDVGGQVLVDNHRDFLREWARFLRLGVTDSPERGRIDQIFWGALGKDNFLQKYGSIIESNRSFVLDTDNGPHENEAKTLQSHCFYESFSDDGNELAVWRVPIQR